MDQTGKTVWCYYRYGRADQAGIESQEEKTDCDLNPGDDIEGFEHCMVAEEEQASILEP